MIATNKLEVVEWLVMMVGLLISMVCAKPLLRLETRLWPPAAPFEGYARGQGFFPTRYGIQFTNRK
ncbi:MAG: hypothetical protein HoeaKO_34170 [Hoeflea alexandrii]